MKLNLRLLENFQNWSLRNIWIKCQLFDNNSTWFTSSMPIAMDVDLFNSLTGLSVWCCTNTFISQQTHPQSTCTTAKYTKQEFPNLGVYSVLPYIWMKSLFRMTSSLQNYVTFKNEFLQKDFTGEHSAVNFHILDRYWFTNEDILELASSFMGTCVWP